MNSFTNSQGKKDESLNLLAEWLYNRYRLIHRLFVALILFE